MQTVDRAWLESHLSQLAKRLQDALCKFDPEQSFAALNGRIETIEQRFGAALGRVAQRADLDGLLSIETHVLELAGQLERARDRLEQIGAIDDQVRALARKLDEDGEQRAGALEKLLRESIAEWREGEQRTASVLHNLEEAVNRLGDTVDAMEASKPAPDLTVPSLPGSGLGRASAASNPRFHAGERTPASSFYHAMLDAADYAPKPIPDGSLPPLQPASSAMAPDPTTTSAAGAVEWSAEQTGTAPAEIPGARLTPGALRIMAVRAKLRQSSTAGSGATLPSAENAEGRSPGTFKQASLSLLLMAGAAFLAGGTYFLYQAFVAPMPQASPAMIEHGAHPAGVKSDLAHPTSGRAHGESAS